MFEIRKNILEKELKYDNTVILKYHIEYPSIKIDNNRIGEERFNLYNKNLALTLQKRSEEELYKDSIEQYKYNKENNYPIMIYEIYRNYEITFNSRNLVSLYADEYIFTGGAHGDTIRTSQTWDFNYNTLLQLYEFYPRNPYFLLGIFKNISNQILKNPDIYFEDNCNLVLNTFNPYSSGIPTFNV